jgi:hypothetical protein
MQVSQDKTQDQLQEKVQKDLKTLALFIEIHCKGHHYNREPVVPVVHKIEFSFGKPLALCPNCTRLLTHAIVKRMHCPMDPKPACKHCPNHCYAPTYRAQIRDVMRYSGKHMVLHGRVDYLLHLLF